MLSNRPKDRLMVCASVDGREAVSTGRQPARDVSRQNTIYGGQVEALEEREHVRIQRGSLIERIQLLDDDVRVANDSAGAIDLAWGSIVIGLRVDEVARHHIGDRHGDREVLIGRDVAEVCWERELRRGKISGG